MISVCIALHKQGLINKEIGEKVGLTGAMVGRYMKGHREYKPKIGFKSFTKAKMREIASMGGKRAHELGRAHIFTKAQAKLAGKKGGNVSKRKKYDTIY